MDCCITRLRALTDARLLADAIGILHGLMIGDRLPQPLTADFRPTELAAEPTIAFNTALPPIEENNMMVSPLYGNITCSFIVNLQTAWHTLQLSHNYYYCLSLIHI